MKALSISSLNPLRCDRSALPTQLLIMAKAMAIAVLITMDWHAMPDVFVPYFTFLDRIPGARSFHVVLEICIVVCAILMIFNLWVRPACLAIGSAYLTANLISLPYFTNSRLFTGCIFFLLGLSEKDQEPWLICYQVMLLYFGGALNKLLASDWRNGEFFSYWGRVYINEKFFLWAVSRFSWAFVSLALSWTTIVTEMVILIGLLVRRFRSWTIWLGLVFHGSTIFLTGRPFGFFMFALPASYLAFVDWPKRMTMLYDGDCSFCTRTRNFFGRFEFDDVIAWIPYLSAPDRHSIPLEVLQRKVHLIAGYGIASGFRAFQQLLLYNPTTYLALAVVFSISEVLSVQRWLVCPLLLLFSPWIAPIGEAVYQRIARDRHSLTTAVPSLRS